jgi:hypothetical protein
LDVASHNRRFDGTCSSIIRAMLLDWLISEFWRWRQVVPPKSSIVELRGISSLSMKDPDMEHITQTHKVYRIFHRPEFKILENASET